MLYLYDNKYSKNNSTEKYYYKLKLYSCDAKATFSDAIILVFSVTLSFRNMLIFMIKKYFLLLSMLKTVVLLNVFMETV